MKQMLTVRTVYKVVAKSFTCSVALATEDY